ncbi:MAG: glycosyltransferase family 4 protein [Defluviitaleaceae bacterium]|nr:glycosyltransferase family 4 protein [Defluviitaleaceae bacterium]
MKILHVLAQLPMRTGSGVYYSNLVEGLKAFGHEQAAVFAVQDGFEWGVLPDNRCFPVEFKSEALPFPIAGMSDIMPYDNTVYSSMNVTMLSQWQVAFEGILGMAKTHFQPDVVILHHLWMLTSMGIKIFDEQVKIGVCHNTDLRQGEQNPLMKEMFVEGLDKLDAVFSLSDDQQQRITDVFGIDPAKIVTMGGGFNQNIFYPHTDGRQGGDKIHIVYAAKIERSKGVFELIEAFKEVYRTYPNIHLHIIGTPDETNKRRIDELIGSYDNIELVHITSQQVLAGYMRGKDIYVMPSYFEGLGLIAIESLATGLRVVATEIEALMSLLGEKVNKSGVIEYVKLPRIYNTDKPVEEDVPQFVEDLADKLATQVARVRKGEGFTKEIESQISTHSWAGIAGRINAEILKLL